MNAGMNTKSNAPATMSANEARSRRSRNLAIALTLIAFMALIYAVTLARLASGAGLPGSAG